MAEVSGSYRSVADLAEIRGEAMAAKTAPRIRTGYGELAAAVVTTKMTVMPAEMPVPATVGPAMVTPAMPVAMTTAVAPTVTSTFADRHARKQGRQNKDHNSDCRFGHGTLPCATR
ncbi:hypothetical protein [Bradyrhizobium sp. AUGA SZCCT0182]|uniref:hypothetical protein n=1 Tax=Bradyrhizobium sp. AUGA SZCCT0182 TaxID=2807667 RepID=UPI002012416A|nr:hypothetical protein [Bradyrhizobium sp. AUGA SZCCT0182]